MLREDGYQIEDLTIQGVRAYDPTTAQWTAPDAYAGDVHDPMSQKPFMWNGNDPVSYTDPSGYLVDPNADKALVRLADDMASQSTTFATAWNAIKTDPSKTYGLVTDNSLTAGSGQTRPGTGSDYAVFAVSGLGDGDDKVSAMAHEIGGHGPDVVDDSFNRWWSVSIGAANDPETGENHNAEEARGFIRQNQILTEMYGSAKAQSMMADDMPRWGADQAPWDIGQISRACAVVSGCSP
jgi:RHS repeat-associated protein